MTIISRQPELVVREWIEAANAGDVDLAGTFVTYDVSIVGPRGTTSGRDVVAGWIRHTGIRMEPFSVSVEGSRVVVEAEGTWRAGEGSTEKRTPPATITMEFVVDDGRIASIQRL